MSSFDSSVHRLAGSSGNEVGGLIVKKKPPQAGEGGGEGGGGSRWDKKPDVFKKPAPRASIFGLDVLAKRKREEREAREEASFVEKRQKISTGREESYSDSDVRVSFGRSSEHQKERTYRQPRVETPSHPGGVCEEALQRIQSRLRREQAPAVGGRTRDRDSDKQFR